MGARPGQSTGSASSKGGGKTTPAAARGVVVDAARRPPHRSGVDLRDLCEPCRRRRRLVSSQRGPQQRMERCISTRAGWGWTEREREPERVRCRPREPCTPDGRLQRRRRQRRPAWLQQRQQQRRRRLRRVRGHHQRTDRVACGCSSGGRWRLSVRTPATDSSTASTQCGQVLRGRGAAAPTAAPLAAERPTSRWADDVRVGQLSIHYISV